MAWQCLFDGLSQRLLCVLVVAMVGTGLVEGAWGASGALHVGVAVVDISPLAFPVIVNGMFEERTAERTVDPLHARALVLDDGETRIAIVVVDSCMLPRELLDEAKARAAKLTGIAIDHMLISATHTHSAPAAMGCLGSRADPDYPAFLVPRLAKVIEQANARLQPARIGFAKVRAPSHTYCRRYIRRPDRIINDPFGEPTVRANMHPGFLSPEAIGPSGPVDDELSVLAMQTREGKPIGVLANFSMHYVGSPMLSSDYFGRFAEHLGKRIDGGDGSKACVVAMSQGTSGDLASMNYGARQNSYEYDKYASELAELAEKAYRNVKYKLTAELAMRESTLKLRRRVPSAERLAWAKELVANIGDRRPKARPEIYALEQIELAAEPERELKLQAVRIGDVAITAIPNEVYALTGLKLKMQSPLEDTFNISLANGAEGYIPPPEQHRLGGYTTWPARTAALEVDAEPKIVETLLKLLEGATGKSRRPIPDAGGAYAAAVRKSKPVGYWRLWDVEGDVARNAIGNGPDAKYVGDVAHYLPGPVGNGFAGCGRPSRAAHFAGGHLRAGLKAVPDTYSVEFWFWNGLPNDARDVTACLFSRGGESNGKSSHDVLGIGGSRAGAGRLFFSVDLKQGKELVGRTVIEPHTWNHVVLAREGKNVRVYLNGSADAEIAGESGSDDGSHGDFFIGGFPGNTFNLEGKMSEVAVYDRALSAEEVARHYKSQ